MVESMDVRRALERKRRDRQLLDEDEELTRPSVPDLRSRLSRINA